MLQRDLDPSWPRPGHGGGGNVDVPVDGAAGPAGAANPTEHLWMHFTRMSSYATTPAPIIERGEGAYIWDSNGRKYLDALSGLFVVQVGHGRAELADIAAAQARKLAYFPIWSFAHPTAIELADRLAAEAPGDLNKVFFSSGGAESVETAWKIAKQYFKLTGKPAKTKVISRAVAYHGTTQGALSITGVPGFRQPFEPLVPGVVRVPNTNFYRAPEQVADDEKQFGLWAANRVEEAILDEGPDTVAAVFVEPLQNAGGCIPPPPGYFERLREICDRYDVLLVSDEVICAYGRLGRMFGAQKYGYQPDMITSAKGLTSGYSPLGAAIISDRVFEPFGKGNATFSHGYTFGGHPVSCAVALGNLEIFEREDLLAHVLRNENAFRQTLERLYDLPIVGDVRGDGYFYAVELVKDKATKQTFDAAERERVLRGYVSPALFETGIYCRTDDRGEPVVQVAPPLICGQAEFDEMEQKLRHVLSTAWTKL
jgi:adenosylmethionine-8-amino-7-oxononanoate aminotransferase